MYLTIAILILQIWVGPPKTHDKTKTITLDLNLFQELIVLKELALAYYALDVEFAREISKNSPQSKYITVFKIDDNVMLVNLQYNWPDKKNKGKLQAWICQPEFMTDPGHHKKSVAKHFYALATKTVN